MRTHRRLALILAFAIPSAALAERGRTPIRLEMELVSLDPESGKGEVRIDLSSEKEASGTEVTLILTAGVSAETTAWTLDLDPGKVRTIFASFRVEKGAGNVAVTARATKVFAPDDSWGDIQSILLRGEPATRLAESGWKYTEVPVMRRVEPGTATVLSTEPVKIPDGSWATTLASPVAPPSKAVGGTPAGPPAASPLLQFTVTGRFRYPDRAFVDRDGSDVLMELRRGDGSAIPGSNFCFTNGDGTFSCAFNHPGSSMRLRIFSYTNLDPGPSRLGVFSPGCGDALGCAYSQDSYEFTCAAGSSCDLGVLGWSITEPWMGAMQMTEDMIRTFEKLVTANLETPQTRPLPGRIVFPSLNSPRYHLD